MTFEWTLVIMLWGLGVIPTAILVDEGKTKWYMAIITCIFWPIVIILATILALFGYPKK